MSDNGFWFTKGLYFFDHITRLGRNAWARPSPCDGWTARHVLGHVIAIQDNFVCSIEGRPPSTDPNRAPDRHAGSDPLRSWSRTRDEILRALDRPGVLDAVVTTLQGEQRVDDMIGFNVVDTTVHGWDLAKAFDVDEELDPALVTRALELVQAAGPAIADAGVFGRPVETTGANEQTRLLAALGRRA